MSAKKSSRTKSDSGGRKSPLKEKRKKAAQFLVWVISFVSVVAVSAIFYGLWQPAVRIHHIEISPTTNADQLELLARQALQGTYFFILPKDSIFFFPERTIEKQILALRPDIASASARRSSFDSLAITSVPRTAAYIWCGTERIDGNEAECFDVDWTGFVFQHADMSTSTPTLLTRVYASLGTASSTENYPIRGVVQAGSSLPEIFSFIKEIKNLGTAIVAIRFHNDDEVSLYSNAGTYLTYVMHHEKNALSLLTAALPSLSLTDGSVEYIDLRFDGKIYIKRKGEVAKP